VLQSHTKRQSFLTDPISTALGEYKSKDTNYSCASYMNIIVCKKLACI